MRVYNFFSLNYFRVNCWWRISSLWRIVIRILSVLLVPWLFFFTVWEGWFFVGGGFPLGGGLRPAAVCLSRSRDWHEARGTQHCLHNSGNETGIRTSVQKYFYAKDYTIVCFSFPLENTVKHNFFCLQDLLRTS